MKEYTLDDLKNRSVNDVQRLYNYGYIGKSLVEEYIKAWNEGPHFCKAVLQGENIRLVDK